LVHFWFDIGILLRLAPLAGEESEFPGGGGVVNCSTAMDPGLLQLPNEDDQPKSFRQPAVVARRKAMLELPHVAPLTRFVEELRQSLGRSDSVPYFDPVSGGVEARVLFLARDPGPATMRSGIISINNDDPSAKTMWELQRKVGLARSDSNYWNTVPWILEHPTKQKVGGTPEMRGPTLAEIRDARIWFDRLISLLPRLRVVVCLGRDAQRGFREFAASQPDYRRFLLIETWHPSMRALNSGFNRRAELEDAVERAVDALQP
jgi:uracil-DNA glycosylase